MASDLIHKYLSHYIAFGGVLITFFFLPFIIYVKARTEYQIRYFFQLLSAFIKNSFFMFFMLSSKTTAVWWGDTLLCLSSYLAQRHGVTRKITLMLFETNERKKKEMFNEGKFQKETAKFIKLLNMIDKISWDCLCRGGFFCDCWCSVFSLFVGKD